MKPRQFEAEVIDEIAEEYRARGYTVVPKPHADDLPAFLADFEPDAIAYGADENIVIEVKDPSQLRGSKNLVRLAHLLEGNPGWRLELVVRPLAGGRRKKSLHEAAQSLLSPAQVANRIKSANLLLEEGDAESALLLAWTALEAVLRRRALASDLDVIGKSPLFVLKLAYTFGHITRGDYEFFERSLHARNHTAHGAEAQVAPSVVQGTLVRIEKLLQEKFTV